MPAAPKRFCDHPNCSTKVVRGKCAAHKKAKKPRPSASARGYDEQWRKTRKLFLMRHRTCLKCARAPATEVDHINPKAKGGTDSMLNLQALCKSCHARKTATHDGGFGNEKRGTR